MLKKLLLNNRTLPVPVPLRTLAEALSWVESALVPPGHTLTRVVLNGRVICSGLAEAGSLPLADAGQRLDERTRLEILVDSPVDLSIQALDAIHNLASVVLGTLKPLAVGLWQSKPIDRQPEVETVRGDLRLVLDLMNHLFGLVDAGNADAAALQGIATMLARVETGLQMARANSDWRGVAKILLNRLEPLLKELVVEADSMQVRVLASRPAQGGRTGALAADSGWS